MNGKTQASMHAASVGFRRLERLGKERMRSKRLPEDAEASFPRQHKMIVSAIENRDVLKFSYEGRERIVEPQTYGMSYTGRYLLRAFQKGGESRSGRTKIAKLFDAARMLRLEVAGEKFEKALPSHNPEDSAMSRVFASLPKPK